ncbi:7950_t:CDS:1, partial [Cetraspora pellucida]
FVVTLGYPQPIKKYDNEFVVMSSHLDTPRSIKNMMTILRLRCHTSAIRYAIYTLSGHATFTLS